MACGNCGEPNPNDEDFCDDCVKKLVVCKACSFAGGAWRDVQHIGPACPWTDADEEQMRAAWKREIDDARGASQ